MAINEQEVIDAAWLAKIHLDKNELGHFKEDLSAILNFVKQIQEVNTDNVQPMQSPINCFQPLRSDEVTETDCRKAAQTLTDAIESDLYRVPKVIE